MKIKSFFCVILLIVSVCGYAQGEAAGNDWTANQKSELIDVFKNNPNKKYIEFQVRTNNTLLKEANAPEKFRQGTTIRIYREDVYKIISEGDNIKIPPIQMNSINFKN